MPYLDLHTINFSEFNQEFDFTIIGAGAAGILIAVKLNEAGHSVLIVESGNFEIDEKIQTLNDVEQTGKEMGAAQWGRKRAIGGTTLAWGGQSLPFSPLDFKQKDWIKNNHWPITYQELKPYYKIANQFMGIDDQDYRGDRLFKKLKLKKRPKIDKDLLDYHVSKWAKEPDFRKKNHQKLEKDITVLYHANLFQINENDGSVKSISIKDHKNNIYNLSIKNLILSVGGIECNRILLENIHLFPKIEHQELLGKGFMDHPCLEIGTVSKSNSYLLQKYFNTHIYHQQKISIRLSLSAEEQIKHQLLNCSASLFFFFNDPDNPYELVKKLSSKFTLKILSQLFRNIPSLFQSIYALFIDRFYFKSKAIASVILMVEQEAIFQSYVTLSEKINYVEQPLAKINWDISTLTWKTVNHSALLLKNEFKRLGLGALNLHPSIQLENKNWKDLLTDVNHHMGGTIMGSIEKESIVDKNLKVWGIKNLHLCSCSVFPSSSHSNPTLTLLALAARLSHHLK